MHLGIFLNQTQPFTKKNYCNCSRLEAKKPLLNMKIQRPPSFQNPRPMLPVTVVIITKNECKNIVACINSARLISNDIIVVDAESEDETAVLATVERATVINLKWNGYGNSRNIGAAAAQYNWILSLDADERITPFFAEQLHQHFKDDAAIVYGFRRRNFFACVEIRYGALGRDKIFRLYNRNVAKWDKSPVHEKLIGSFNRKYLNLSIDHYTIKDQIHYEIKSMRYAYLCAAKYFDEGRTAPYVKRQFASTFNFLKSYLFLLGFLDGKRGLAVAKVNAHYTWLKYHHLHQLTTEQSQLNEPDRTPSFRFSFHSSLK